MSEIPFHPLANLFPLIEGEAFDDLVSDIRVNGQRDPIVTLDGMILDGRNRYRGSRAAGLEPRFREFGSDPTDAAASLLDDIEIIAEWEFAVLRPRDESGRLKRDAAGCALAPVGSGCYRTHQVWAKDRAGTGYWFRNRHELLLVAVRGDVPAPLMGTQDASLVNAPVAAHSQKPFCFREMIDRHYPGLPKIELFCRGAPAPGWHAFGKEALPSLAGAAPAKAACAVVMTEAACAKTPAAKPGDDPFEIPDFLRRTPPDYSVGAAK